MKYMRCNTCGKAVIYNLTGSCLACQRGFTLEKQDDEIDNTPPKPKTAKIPDLKQVEDPEIARTPISQRKKTKEK